ncbi:MAG: phage integrase N-terminal SAM-like domain-containing protein [Smithella sp.]|jgi:site-specific recombinase XerD|nr:phage integrase N-terminal SAM-like domain-containing protein [Smithella sp.]
MIQPEINHAASFKEKPATATAPAIRIVGPMPTTDNKPKLLTQLSQAIRSRHYSRSTEATYVHWIKRFIFFHHVRHPQEMAEPEINAFLTHLAVKENVSASTQNQALCAIIFLYKYVLNRKIGDIGEVIRARKPVRLPVVMTKAEVKAVMRNLTGDKWIIVYLNRSKNH